MAKDKTWHGIPREDIPWYPTVDAQACIGCGLCFVTCGRGVYEMQDRKAVAVNPMDCMVGCSTCATVCPAQAIRFPQRDVIWKLEREHKIFKVVRQESRDKKEKLDALKARAQEAMSKATTRARIEVAGEFCENRFQLKLEDLIRGRPYDLVNLRVDVPTLQGALEKTPSFMSFEVTSTTQEDIQSFLQEVRTLIQGEGLILVSESKL